MLELVSPSQVEIIIRNSRFLAELFPVDSAELAREKLREQKLLHAQSSHVVHAFVVGLEAGILGCSDDGEPPGTAGRPMLEVLRNSELRNVLLTVARWFGGTKLGTGGLVRAYTECAQAALAQAQTRPLIERSQVSFLCPYALYEQIKLLLAELEFECSNEDFAEEVLIAGELPSANLTKLKNQLRELSHGRIELE
ncbi:MAG: YigZ family protein [Lentisphaeria bacterium]|jgi:uncharacterized YigZ family protein|nr:YigZ family protein [Lentisphaeria bacterium]